MEHDPQDLKLAWRIEELGLITLAQTPLLLARIWSVNDLVQCSPRDLLALPGFGQYCLADVVAKLALEGLELSKTNYRLIR